MYDLFRDVDWGWVYLTLGLLSLPGLLILLLWVLF